MNIILNVSFVLLSTFYQAYYRYKQRANQDRIKKLLVKRNANREIINKEVPGVFKEFDDELSTTDAIKYCKGWIVYRKWLQANNIKFDEFPEEIEYKKLCSDYKLIDRVTLVQISKSMRVVARRLAEKQVNKIKAENSKIMARRKFLESQKYSTLYNKKVLKMVPEENSDEEQDSERQIVKYDEKLLVREYY